MLTIDEKISSSHYWTTHIKNEFFRAFYAYQEKEGLTYGEICDRLQIKLSKLKQILNGDFKGGIDQFVGLSLKIGLIPFVKFYDIYKYLEESKTALFGLSDTLIITPYPEKEFRMLKTMKELYDNQVTLDTDIAEMIEEKFWDMID